VYVIESFFVRVKSPIPDATVKKKNVRASGTINNNNAFLLNYIFYFFADDDFEETKRLWSFAERLSYTVLHTHVEYVKVDSMKENK
jgi:hypothetical protein